VVNLGGESFALKQGELDVFFVTGGPTEQQVFLGGDGGNGVQAHDGARVGAEDERGGCGEGGLRGEPQAHGRIRVGDEHGLVRQAQRRIAGERAAHLGLGVGGENEEFAGGQLGMRGGLGADAGVFVRGELAHQVRRCAGICREVCEHGGRGTRGERFEQVAR